MESQNASLTYESENERLKALDAIDERDPSNESIIDDILKAQIAPKSEAATQNPADSVPAAMTDESAGKKVEESAAQNQLPPSASGANDDVLTIRKNELPEGFDSFGKMAKSYAAGQELIKRQEKFIKEKLAGGDQNVSAAIRRAEAAEAQLKEVQKRYERPAQAQTQDQNLTAIPNSKLPQIKQLKDRYKELSKDPISNEEEIHSVRIQIDEMLIEENERSEQLIMRAAQRAEEAERRASQADERTTSFLNQSEQSKAEAKANEALKAEFKEMDSFADKYSEFKLEKSSGEVEKEYIEWAREVTSLYYGAPVNIQTKEGMKSMHNALAMLNKGAPDITEKCKLSGVPTQPSSDVKRYLEMCELLDYRDGYRVDPISGNKEIVQRYHAPTGQYVPDTFPSLNAAYEDRRVRDGVYEKRIRESYAKGGAAMAAAIAKRDNGVAEMDNSGGVSRSDAGLSMSMADARKAFETIDENVAERMRRQGDPTLWNRLNEAMIALNMGGIDS